MYREGGGDMLKAAETMLSNYSSEKGRLELMLVQMAQEEMGKDGELDQKFRTNLKNLARILEGRVEHMRGAKEILGGDLSSGLELAAQCDAET